MGLLTADPALVWGGEVRQEQGEDHHVEKLGRQSVDGVVELAQEGLYRVTSQLERLLELKVEEVTLVHTLTGRKRAEILNVSMRSFADHQLSLSSLCSFFSCSCRMQSAFCSAFC